jgi:hypothetical protein
MEEIEMLLRSRRTEDRIRAVHKLARSSSPDQQALLLRALEDRVNYVAALAAEALGRVADASSAARMVVRFVACMEDGRKRDPGCHIRTHLAQAFARLEYVPAIEALRAGIRTVQVEPVGGVAYDTAAHLRGACALALAELGAPDALRDITLLLFDHGTDSIGSGDARLLLVEPRKAAVRALARLSNREALVPLALRLRFPTGESPDVLQECMQAVVEREDPRALELLEPYIRHRDPSLAAYAALMIAQTQAPEAPALLRAAIQALSGDALRAAVLAINVLRSDEGRGLLQELASSEREAVRLAVVEALATAPDAMNRARLETLAQEDLSSTVRNTAKRALAAL